MKKFGWTINNGAISTTATTLAPRSMVVMNDKGKAINLPVACRQWHTDAVIKMLARYMAVLAVCDDQEQALLRSQAFRRHPELVFVQSAHYVALVDRHGNVMSDKVYTFVNKAGNIGGALTIAGSTLVRAIKQAPYPTTDSRLWTDAKVVAAVNDFVADVVTKVDQCAIVGDSIQAIKAAHQQEVASDLQAQRTTHTTTIKARKAKQTKKKTA